MCDCKVIQSSGDKFWKKNYGWVNMVKGNTVRIQGRMQDVGKLDKNKVMKNKAKQKMEGDL